MFLTNKTFQNIINQKGTGTKLSIYIPTHPASTPPTLSEDIIRFKNALQEIKASEKFDQRELGETMEKMETLLGDLEFWKHRTIGLAVFADKDGYQLIDVHYDIADAQYVQAEYIVSPPAILLSIGTGYYVLDINHTKPRLLHFTAHSRSEVALADMPGSFEEAIGRDERLQHMQHQSGPKNMFHGQSESGAMDEDTLRYYKLIARAVDQYLADHDSPLLLAGTENRIGHMRPLLEYANVLRDTFEGNHEHLNDQQFQTATTAIIEAVACVKRDAIVEKVKSVPPSDLAIGALEIEEAIAKGQVATLFLPSFQYTADNVRDGEAERIVLHLPEDTVERETLVRGTVAQGGAVVAVALGSFESDEPRALRRY
jgi:hypothetical protein